MAKAAGLVPLEAIDPDNEPVRFRLFSGQSSPGIGQPPGLIIDPITGEISGRIRYRTAGTYPVTVSVADVTIDRDRDRLPERMFRFYGEAVRAVLPVESDTSITLTGLADAARFAGSETVRVIDPHWRKSKL